MLQRKKNKTDQTPAAVKTQLKAVEAAELLAESVADLLARSKAPNEESKHPSRVTLQAVLSLREKVLKQLTPGVAAKLTYLLDTSGAADDEETLGNRGMTV